MTLLEEIEDLVEHGDLPRGIADATISVWKAILDASDGRMPEPAMIDYPSEVELSWHRQGHAINLEIEIKPGRDTEVVFLDFLLEERWIEDWAIGEPIPSRLASVLHRFYGPEVVAC